MEPAERGRSCHCGQYCTVRLLRCSIFPFTQHASSCRLSNQRWCCPLQIHGRQLDRHLAAGCLAEADQPSSLPQVYVHVLSTAVCACASDTAEPSDVELSHPSPTFFGPEWPVHLFKAVPCVDHGIARPCRSLAQKPVNDQAQKTKKTKETPISGKITGLAVSQPSTVLAPRNSVLKYTKGPRDDYALTTSYLDISTNQGEVVDTCTHLIQYLIASFLLNLNVGS